MSKPHIKMIGGLWRVSHNQRSDSVGDKVRAASYLVCDLNHKIVLDALNSQEIDLRVGVSGYEGHVVRFGLSYQLYA